MCASPRARDRLAAIAAMRDQSWPRLPRSYLDLATKLIEDSNNDCRWQALILTKDYMEKEAAAVWAIIFRHAGSEDEDMRMGIACCLLEHMNWTRFDAFLRRLKRLVQKCGPNAKDTISHCWFDDMNPRQQKLVSRLVGSRMWFPSRDAHAESR